MSLRRVSALVGLGLAASGCLSTTGPNSGKQAATAITGLVKRADGSPVSGPLVTVQLTTKPAGGTAQLIAQANVIAADDGNFLFVFLLNGYDAQDGVVNLTVTPPIGTPLLPFDSAGIPVKLVAGALATDTAFVFVTMQPRP
jgi:hypothetical protein